MQSDTHDHCIPKLYSGRFHTKAVSTAVLSPALTVGGFTACVSCKHSMGKGARKSCSAPYRGIAWTQSAGQMKMTHSEVVGSEDCIAPCVRGRQAVLAPRCHAGAR